MEPACFDDVLKGHGLALENPGCDAARMFALVARHYHQQRREALPRRLMDCLPADEAEAWFQGIGRTLVQVELKIEVMRCKADIVDAQRRLAELEAMEARAQGPSPQPSPLPTPVLARVGSWD